MEREIMTIKKSLIPYDFDIVLGGVLFNITVNYNKTGRFFTLGLIRNGETICSGEPIVYGRKLFADVKNDKFPTIDIIPLDLSGRYNAVTRENLCEEVLLIVDNGTLEV